MTSRQRKGRKLRQMIQERARISERDRAFIASTVNASEIVSKHDAKGGRRLVRHQNQVSGWKPGLCWLRKNP